ncbi:MAG: thioredoxin family protein [Sulfolobaceae archaeon]
MEKLASEYVKDIRGLTLEGCKSEEFLREFEKGNSIVINRDCEKPYIKIKRGSRTYFTYYGIPSGNELLPFLNSLIWVVNGSVDLEAKGISGEVKLFVTPSCTKCPFVAELLYKLALVNDRMSLEIYDAEVYEEEASKFRVLSVPKIIINGKEIPGSFLTRVLIEMMLRASYSR